MRVLVPLAVVAVVVAASGTAHAQYTNSYGYSFDNPVTSTANQFFWDGLNRRLLLRMLLKKRGYTDAQLGQMSTAQMRSIIEGGPVGSPQAGAPRSGSPPVATRSHPGATRFQPTAQRLLVGTIVNSLLKDAAQRQALVELFDGAIRTYEDEGRRTGLDHDIAGAMAFFIGAAYLVQHDGQEPDDAGIQLIASGLREQMSTAEVAAISAADKQKFYELMLVLGTFLMASRQQAVSDGDAATVASLKAAAGDALKGFLRLDPASFRITRNGLELIRP
jgi:hypothetical protein